MKRLLTKFRDWWNWRTFDAVMENRSRLIALDKKLIELNNQMDFLKYQVAGLMSDEEWRKALAGHKSALKLRQSSGCPALE
jgi:hypothetical protein